LLHLAWIATPGVYWTSPENERWVETSRAMAEAFRDAGGRRLVVAGTCAEYEWGDVPCREAGTPLKPATPYGKAKVALFRSLTELCQEGSTSLAWGRIFHLYGPHENANRLVPAVIRSLLSGEEARTTSGQQVRGLLHVSDVARGFVSLLDNSGTGSFNIGSSEPVTVAQVVMTIADQLGARDRVRLGAIPTSPSDPTLLIADDQRLRDAGWSPAITLDNGIAETIDWWRSELQRMQR
jgi:nucleoside-diphosphate-sugar epimerase